MKFCRGTIKQNIDGSIQPGKAQNHMPNKVELENKSWNKTGFS